MEETPVLFVATGGFLAHRSLRQLEDSEGEVVGFETPDGRILRLVAAIEVQTGDDFSYVASDTEMADLGLLCFDYHELSIIPSKPLEGNP